jgi:ribosomal protein L23
MAELKSAIEIALEKSKKIAGEEEAWQLTPEQKNEIAQIRQIYAAKVAEVEILVTDPEKREIELVRLRRERDGKIEAIYQKAKAEK